MASNVDELVRNNGQLAIAVSAQEGDMIYPGGTTDTKCIVNTEEGAQLAIKVYGLSEDKYAIGYLRLAQTIPTAAQKHLGKVYMYVGPTNDTYTHGYIYECTGGTVYSGSIEFTPNQIEISNDDYANFLKASEKYIENAQTITHGTMTYHNASGLWMWDGYDTNDSFVGRRKIYQGDYEQFGFIFTGPFSDGDEFTFTTSITATPGDFAWTRIDVQP